MPTYYLVIIYAWSAFILIWAISALWVKRDIRGGGFAGLGSKFIIIRLLVLALVVFVLTRFFSGTHFSFGKPTIFENIFIGPIALAWIGAVLTVLGVTFAVWARFHLGRNWSGIPSVKENHELVTSGPYAYVRHPIYTGMLLAALGTALTGVLFGIAVLIFGSVIFLFRIKKEEGIMLELFPDKYPAYQARTKRLIPFIW